MSESNNRGGAELTGQARETLMSQLCKKHDITHAYSDDSVVFNRGEIEHAVILKVAKTLPHPIARQLWNDAVDAQITDQALREEFYWPHWED